MRSVAGKLAMVALCLVLGESAASAWSREVHVVICEGAWQLLGPEAKRFLREVRREARQAGLPSAGKFSESCRWPDESRRTSHVGTYENHYLNVESDSAETIDPDRDCAALDCVPLAVRRFTSYLARPAESERLKVRKEQALRFVGHFVADLHQPLHTGYLSDLGGNGIQVRWLGPGYPLSLHAAWDAAIPAEAGVVAGFEIHRLVEEIPAEELEAWRRFDVWEWADESFALARSHVYVHPSGEPVESGDRIKKNYVERAAPVARRQILKSVVRLAAILERVAGGEDPFAADSN